MSATQHEQPPRDRERFVWTETFGCQMNVYDTERMLERLEGAGYATTDDPSLADLILLNTCSVRDKSEHKMVSMLGTFRKLKEHNPELVIAVAGCVATQEGDRLLGKVPHLDLVLGPDQVGEIPALVRSVRDGRQAEDEALARVVDTEFIHRKRYSFVEAQPPADGRVTSFITVMKGCNKFCSFCIVPFTRGREVSKPSDDVVAEAALLAAHGVREVTLLGQNVNSYGKDLRRSGEVDFAGLIRKVAAVDGIERVRFTTSHPMDCNDTLIEAFGDVPELMPWFHLPIQSGSPRVLRMMRRSHGVDDYLARIDRLRTLRPNIAMTTDIICGFPGETEEDHQLTLRLLEQVRYSSIYSFMYSERPGTAAARIEDDVPLATKKRRLAEVQALQGEITNAWMAGFAGREVEVLFEGRSTLTKAGPASKRAAARLFGPPQVMGRTPENIKVNIDATDPEAMTLWPGRRARVRVTEVKRHSLRGEILTFIDGPERASRAA